MEARFDPEITFTHDQRAQIAHTIATPGFEHINRILRSIVDRFVLDLINVDEDDDNAVLGKHKLSKAAAQFYESAVSRINWESQQFMRDASGPVEPTDPTEGSIDLGEFAKAEEPMSYEGLFEGLELNEQLLEEELNSD